MKVLVYGSGVIGSYLAHVLCSARNDVTVLARGRWREQLETHGLRIRHHLQRSQTLDQPKVIGDISEGDSYDAVFAVMPYNKIGAILEPLAAVRAPLVVLVGNNMNPAAMERFISGGTVCEKQVLFGFQVTAGKRDMEKGLLVCERLGAGNMDLGGLHRLPDEATRSKLNEAFAGTGYRLSWQPDMEAYLVCHLAAILPIGYLALRWGYAFLHRCAAQADAAGLPRGLRHAENARHPHTARGRRPLLRPRPARKADAVPLFRHGEEQNHRRPGGLRALPQCL